MSVCVDVCLDVCLDVCTCMYMYIHVQYVCTCMYVCMCVCMCECVSISIFGCVQMCLVCVLCGVDVCGYVWCVVRICVISLHVDTSAQVA